ncbi:MAG: hypothetical protein A3H57_03305 [Candidatus Taylorbacteria bacterium RIFCSPLOWO2_02_FULL_43_11]|uniref:Xylose isomerase-like TIM barrel domain-containing protein n=1 Tax=Candidatus Taylorbacteria bacterium RIFCSPHIGHO2_02_FULL_43_32b TaxID=1802306 RepID=A0A1G2MEF2_9BACT|nr:MAG: hypothetical protein A2743_02415 [Candidatus Taylorbacteria bacterium RIFCSPHIGHO2_01_FULL_43_47]OHA22247.1 MAG: hypothetical protein A3C72_04090 [Candidatus Taylorbacteria bacterium RIFCSPHIGHO2_02_FULL_43_32b]OHA29618.1 MAG: hypothetical protein A3B08_03305 [Candidatus Taylorbacteria bacterium RIFCSPLOWO2_01_FULL_43_44]OHA36132.1 MAG: hypothetical protein A3H57_03305 [Candidatus Taylorbacteria bacterium RIFCSPLOWO2_02_FULL_43_11]
MTKTFGGLFLENLVSQDQYFERQCQLFQSGHTHGVQLRVAHPSFTPELIPEALPWILNRLPSGMELFIHYGAENVGVDLGQTLDELGVFSECCKGTGKTWKQWNLETLQWGIDVATAVLRSGRLSYRPLGVIHPGYGRSKTDPLARDSITDALTSSFNPVYAALETVPQEVDRDWYGPGPNRMLWSQDYFWAVGANPTAMAELIAELDDSWLGWHCLLDFTHIWVTANQLYTEVDKLIAGFLKVRHSKVCHFSGCPPRDCFIDDHSHIGLVDAVVAEAMRTMDVICLEIPFGDDSPQVIETFRRDCGLD